MYSRLLLYKVEILFKRCAFSRGKPIKTHTQPNVQMRNCVPENPDEKCLRHKEDTDLQVLWRKKCLANSLSSSHSLSQLSPFSPAYPFGSPPIQLGRRFSWHWDWRTLNELARLHTITPFLPLPVDKGAHPRLTLTTQRGFLHILVGIIMSRATRTSLHFTQEHASHAMPNAPCPVPIDSLIWCSLVGRLGSDITLHYPSHLYSGCFKCGISGRSWILTIELSRG